jgi:putative transposase
MWLYMWLYLRFTLSFWDVEELLLASRAVIVSYEAIRQWTVTVGLCTINIDNIIDR